MRRFLVITLVAILAGYSNPLARDLFNRDTARVGQYLEATEVGAAVRRSYQAASSMLSDQFDTRAGQAEVDVPEPGNESLLVGGCSMTPEQIIVLLNEFDSPALREPGIAEHITAECRRTEVDSAVVIAQFVQESGAGTAPGWAGNLPGGETSKNPGNIICLPNARQSGCYGRFGTYTSWAEGFSDKFELLACYAEPTRPYCTGLWTGAPLQEATVTAAIYRWAPPSDNNDSARYARYVNGFVDNYRALNQGATIVFPALAPQDYIGAPVRAEVGKHQAGEVASPVMPVTGFGPYSADCLYANVVYSLERSPGLRRIVIPPGGDFSFNENWLADPADLVSCGYAPGAGVCDWAALILDVSRQMGLDTETTHHGLQLSLVSWENSIAIWGVPGQRGGQDLVVRNNTDRTAVVEARYNGIDLYYIGYFK